MFLMNNLTQEQHLDGPVVTHAYPCCDCCPVKGGQHTLPCPLCHPASVELAYEAAAALLDAATDADALRAELAHMTEARDNARAEVERLTAVVERARALHFGEYIEDQNRCLECGDDYPCPPARELDEEPQP